MSFAKHRMVSQLVTHEGIRLKPYRDSEGILTIGVGRNLEDKGISESEAMILLDNDITDAYLDSQRLVPNFARLNGPRKQVIVNMMFNLGWPRLRGFKKMLAALAREDFDEAAREMLDSKWAGQVGLRAVQLADIMRRGTND